VTGGAPGTTCADIDGATDTEYSPQLADEGATLRLQVSASNAGGTTSAVSAAVGPVTPGAGNTPPVPVIEAPAVDFRWSAGQTIAYSGSATDTEDGDVPALHLSWNMMLGHCTTAGCHEHPLGSSVGAGDTVATVDHEAPSYIEFTLTARDSVGATASVTRRIDPQTVTLTFDTAPTGLFLSAGAGQSMATPFSQLWVVNSQVQLIAPATQTQGSTSYEFTGWSDDGAATHIVNAPATNTTYTASYTGTCLPTSYSASVLGDSPSYYWRLGETSGTSAADASGNNRPGTYVNGVVLNQPGALTGDANRAVTLDGTNDRVGRNPAAGISGTAISTDLWLKTSNTTKEAGIVSYATSGSTEEFHLRDPRSLDVYVKGTMVSTGVVLNDGLWHHLAVTWTSSGGALRVYKDGALAFSGTVRSGASLTANGALVLGQDQDSVNGGFSSGQSFLGQLDEVALYPSALSQARVQAHRQIGVDGGSCAAAAPLQAAALSTTFLRETAG
jgi:hypothetical protein